jgi:hypothetical protein
MPMDEQDLQQIGGLANALTGVRDWEVDNLSIEVAEIEKLVPSGIGRTNRIAARMAYEWDEVTRPHKMEYREMLKALLGDNAWGPIASILEGYNPQTAQRLDTVRRAILNDVCSDCKLKQSVTMDGHKLVPTPALRQAIEGLISALRDVAGRAETSEERAGERKASGWWKWLSGWLWTLYETTIKAAFEAIFKQMNRP